VNIFNRLAIGDRPDAFLVLGAPKSVVVLTDLFKPFSGTVRGLYRRTVLSLALVKVRSGGAS